MEQIYFKRYAKEHFAKIMLQPSGKAQSERSHKEESEISNYLRAGLCPRNAFDTAPHDTSLFLLYFQEDALTQHLSFCPASHQAIAKNRQVPIRPRKGSSKIVVATRRATAPFNDGHLKGHSLHKQRALHNLQTNALQSLCNSDKKQ